MAATRVSLSMDDSVLERARHHSEVRKVSISKLFVSMVCMLDDAENSSRGLPPLTRQLKGLLKPKEPLAADWDYRALLGERKMERFGGQ